MELKPIFYQRFDHFRSLHRSWKGGVNVSQFTAGEASPEEHLTTRLAEGRLAVVSKFKPVQKR
jgi:hypothetical protein